MNSYFFTSVQISEQKAVVQKLSMQHHFYFLFL